jgi:hypothetical protein
MSQSNATSIAPPTTDPKKSWFSNPFKTFGNYIVKQFKAHPLFATAAVLALITAAVFSGGALFAAPAALAVMQAIGVAVSFFIAAVGVYKLKTSLAALKVADSTSPLDHHGVDEVAQKSQRNKSIMGTVVSLGLAIASILVPPVGIVTCGLYAAGLVGFGTFKAGEKLNCCKAVGDDNARVTYTEPQAHLYNTGGQPPVVTESPIGLGTRRLTSSNNRNYHFSEDALRAYRI